MIFFLVTASVAAFVDDAYQAYDAASQADEFTPTLTMRHVAYQFHSTPFC